MKKSVAYLVVAALISATACTTALANRPNPYLCRMIGNSLQRAGYHENATYRTDEIKELLRSVGVIPPQLSFLSPTAPYQLSYRCALVEGVARPELTVRSSDDKWANDVVTTIKWEMTN